ncbi:14175_t:CDS:1 [Ambispora leptoticha]|uniref:14175_t:CDS:1 n=1 Tax=Ambispora leptoticha TaxID=144679 RepID=A0A9N9G060_9GLOM|nr:14175_t:CDS:1 [Ambispora leptoticha]
MKNNAELSNLLSATLESMSPPFPPEITAEEIIVPKQDGKAPTKAPNNFLIYRKAFVKTLNSKGIFLPMRAISLAISKRWKSEPAWIKDAYTQIANEAGQLLNERHYGLWDSYLITDCHIKASSRPAGVVARPRIKSSYLTQPRPNLNTKLNKGSKRLVDRHQSKELCPSIDSMISEFNVKEIDLNMNKRNFNSQKVDFKNQHCLETVVSSVSGEQKVLIQPNSVDSDGKIKNLNQPMDDPQVFKKYDDSSQNTPPITPEHEARPPYMSSQSSSTNDSKEDITCEKQNENVAESTYNEFLLTEMNAESSAYFYNHSFSNALENFYFVNEFSSSEEQFPYYTPNTDCELDPLEGSFNIELLGNNISNLAVQSSNQFFFVERSPCYN